MALIAIIRTYLTLVSFVLFSSGILAQLFSIGYTSEEFYDSVRDRNITTKIYYPSDNPGENEPISNGNFPLIVFGHGYLMTWEAYENFWTTLVPEGYVICFPTTEMGITPDHEQFGQDLKFIAAQMQIETQENSSLFYNSIAPETALTGHSMGGGASFLAAENNSTIKTLINFAAAETNPSAISAASNIAIPSLLFSGDDDCVTPPIDHQDIMFVNLSSDCKTQIKIINGGHCYFANDNFICDFGESLCNADLNITREEQQEVTNDFLKLWLDYSLKGNLNSFTVFNDSLQNSNRINYLQNCNSLEVRDPKASIQLEIFPNPALNNLSIVIPSEHADGVLSIYNLVGQKLYHGLLPITASQIDISSYMNGPYYIVYNIDSMMYYGKFFKVDR